ncbi:MAG: hypothetical protein JXN60_09125, partial [Lentisphaerae bacterium]|nr:hypothetical protein [Lentisphaerota bacterium]
AHRGKFKDALEAANDLEQLGVADTIVKSWTLMELNRIDESEKVLNSLPEQMNAYPEVAIVRAEHAARRDKLTDVVKSIAIAARSMRLMRRVRALYPYLVAREQWSAIAAADNPDAPFEQFMDAMIVIDANLRIGNLNDAANAVRRGLVVWPDDPRFLKSLFMLIARRYSSEWGNHIISILRKHIGELDPETLADSVISCFELKRPDIAWLAYARLAVVDPTHPTLYLSAARFGEAWFTVRRQSIGLSAENEHSEIDLKPLIAQTRHIPPFESLWDAVPLADELGGGDIVGMRDKYLQLYFDEVAGRKAKNSLSRQQELGYVDALALAGRYENAHNALRDIVRKHPEQLINAVRRHAVLYGQQGRWQEAYESVRKYRNSSAIPILQTEITMITAMMNLNMGFAALDVAEKARIKFPDSSRIEGVIAWIWSAFNFKEQALFVLTKNRINDVPEAEAQLLFDTGRLQEADKMCRGLGIQIRRDLQDQKPWLVLPAELSIMKRWSKPWSQEEMKQRAKSAKKKAEHSVSPFLRDLFMLEADWFSAKGADSTLFSGWLAAGRDDTEKAIAMYHLAMLLARQEKYEDARAAAASAIDFMPASAVLWRVLIALSDGDSGVVAKAFEKCPEDPEIWLASIVTAIQQKDMDNREERMLGQIERAVETQSYSVKTMIRAGDFLLRNDVSEPAFLAAEDAISRCRGLVTAYVLGIRCAVKRRDLKKALSYSLMGADHTDDPAPFYKMIVGLKSLGNEMDADTVAALEYLNQHFPQDPQWAERLGQLYFSIGDTERAMTVMDTILLGGIKNVRVDSLVLAAEVARLEGQPGKTLEILEHAYRSYPTHMSVLNNLIYSLAANPNTVDRAASLLPGLLAMAGERNSAVFDTAAMVYLNMGQQKTAWEYMQMALANLDRNSSSALEINLNAAIILHQLGRHSEAKQKLEIVRGNPRCPDVINMAACALFDKLPK